MKVIVKLVLLHVVIFCNCTDSITQNGTQSDDYRQVLLKKYPEADMDNDGKLNTSELWHIKTLATKSRDKESMATAIKVLNAEFNPAPINENKDYRAPNSKKIKLFILSGQSNMVGQGLSKELEGVFPDALVPNERILMFENGKWQPLQPLIITFGPEIMFAHEMAKAWPNETIGIVKQGKGGTGILAWSPDWTKEKADLTGDAHKGNLWKALIRKVKDAQEAAPCETEGFVWMQGAKDMRNLQTAEAYLDNLEAFFSAMRQEVNVPELPIVLGSYRMNGLPDKITESNITDGMKPSEKSTIQVLKAQWDIQDLAPPVKMIPLRNIQQHPKPNVHFNTNGQLQLGKAFAEGYLQLVR